MAACDFDYYKPSTLAEAIAQLATLEDVRPLAGGQSLLPQLFSRRLTCRSLVDLSAVRELASVREDAGVLVVGAMCRQATLERTAGLWSLNPMLAEALSRLGPLPVRSRGTIGGNLACGDPAGELVAVALAQDWRLRIQSRSGVREALAESFLAAPHRVDLARDELLHSVTLPIANGDGWAIEDVRAARTARPLAGVAARLCLDDEGSISDARVVAFATGWTPHRLRPVEACLVGDSGRLPVLDAAERAAHAAVDARDDFTASAVWRRVAVARLTRRALQVAIDRATGVRHV